MTDLRQGSGSVHELRRVRSPGQPYVETDADEFRPGNMPHVLLCSGDIVGVVRIDLIDEVQAGLRLIGIRTDEQRRGHGAALLRLAEQVARDFGRRDVVINAHPTSLQFYLANGYARGDWRDAGPVHPDLVRVGKALGGAVAAPGNDPRPAD